MVGRMVVVVGLVEVAVVAIGGGGGVVFVIMLAME